MIKREMGNGSGKWEREQDFGEREMGEIELKIENWLSAISSQQSAHSSRQMKPWTKSVVC